MQKKLKTSLKSIAIISFIILGTRISFAKVKTIIYDEKELNKENSKYFLNEVSVNLVNIHLAIGYQKEIFNNSEDSILALIQKLEKLNQINIVEAMSLSKDKEITLENYLKEIHIATSSADSEIVLLEQEVAFLEADMNLCYQQKANADTDYYNSIANNDETRKNLALEESIKYGTCATENKINYNAQLLILNKLKYYTEQLLRKYSYLDSQHDIIVEHFDLIETDKIEEILNTKEILEYYNY